MEQMSLLDKAYRKIDQRKTAYNVKLFFNKIFPSYLMMAGKTRTYISSPNLDPTGVSAHGGLNRAESRAVDTIRAENAIDAVTYAINRCEDTPKKPYRTILASLYGTEELNIDVAMKVGYQPSQYNVKKNEALAKFADWLENCKHDFNVTDEDIPSLLVFKKPKKENRSFVTQLLH